MEITTEKDIVLTPHQSEGLEKILHWLFKEPDKLEFVFSGLAGTGKTSLLKFLCKLLSENNTIYSTYQVAAFTGKAGSVLRRKGVPAITLHKLLYEAIWSEEEQKYLFNKKEYIDCELVIVDEASMISKSLLEDLRYHGKKILWVGDSAQLEPVGDNPYIMREPDYMLTEIHRQALENPIILFAHTIRQGGKIPKEFYSDELVITDYSNLKYILKNEKYDITICGKNNTRVELNEVERTKRNFSDNLLNINEQIICLKNNDKFGIYNGNIFTIDKQEVDEYNPKEYMIDFHDDLNQQWKNIPLTTECFGVAKPEVKRYSNFCMYADFGYTISCHKSQGSQFDTVLGIDEPIIFKGMDPKRWEYTLATRASKKLIFIHNKRG